MIEGAYYALSIGTMVLGLVVWTVRQENRIRDLEQQLERLYKKIAEEIQDIRALSERGLIVGERQTEVLRRLDILEHKSKSRE